MKSITKNYFKVLLEAGGTFQLTGSLTNASSGSYSQNYSQTVVNVLNSSLVHVKNGLLSINVPQSTTSPVTSQVFTNTTGVPATFYIEINHGGASYLHASQLQAQVTPIKTLTLFLDTDGSFDNDHSSDLESFIPGAWSDGSSRPLPAANSPIQTVQIIAAYVDQQRSIVSPPSNELVEFTLNDSFGQSTSSAFQGVAMNWPDPRGDGLPDFVLEANSEGFGADNTARVLLDCWDYGGFATVAATQDSTKADPMVLPKASNYIPDAGWKADDGQLVVDAQAPDADGDLVPGGRADGDGVTVWEEYRGFVVNGSHRRTNPDNKNVFVSSDLAPGYGDAEFLCDDPGAAWSCVRIEYPVTQGEYSFYIDGQNNERRLINAYYQNAGFGGTPAGHSDQAALRIEEGGFKSDGLDPNGHEKVVVGETPVISISPLGGPMNVKGAILLYSASIRYASPPTKFNDTVPDPYDDEKALQTVGHELGHAVGINHWTVAAFPDRTPTVMVTIDYFSSDDAWLHVPHSYDATDRAQFMLR